MNNTRLIEFVVPGDPVAQPRQRHRVCTNNGRAMVCNYTPAKDPVNAYKRAIQICARQAYSGTPIDGAVRVSLVAVFERPKSRCKKQNSREPKTTKPDIDNLQKSVFDALNGIVWRDDSCVCAVLAVKELCGDGEEPHTSILIETI